MGEDWLLANTEAKMFTHEKSLRFSPSKSRMLSFGSAPLASCMLWRGMSSGHTIELCEAENTTVLIPRRGRLKVQTQHQQLHCSVGDVLICAPGERVTQVFPDELGLYACEAALIPTSQRDVPSLVSLLEKRFNGALCLKYDASQGRTLKQYLSFVFDDAHRCKGVFPDSVSASAAALLEDLVYEVVHGFDACTENLTSSGSFADKRLVALAEDYMQEHYAHPLTSAEIAKRLSVTPRRLQYAFKSVRGLSPRIVLSNLRLDEARRLLQSAGPEASVMDVALDCGFSHAGRFAKSYANRFGELPSTMLQRRRN